MQQGRERRGKQKETQVCPKPHPNTDGERRPGPAEAESSRGGLHIPALARGIADWIWPPRCPVCDDVMRPGELICPDCRKRVQPVSEPVCKRCGKPLENERREYCTDCARGKHVYRQGKAVFVYRDGIRRSMYRFKYANRREYAEFYANEAARLHGRWIRGNRIEVIVPVPMFAGKKRRRGYNQAETFARALGKKLDLPVDADLVRRVVNTVPQKELNDKERQHNLKNAFQLQTDIVEYRQVLLVDDIYTTGSTMDAVSQALLAGGARNVYYICISIGAGF